MFLPTDHWSFFFSFYNLGLKESQIFGEKAKEKRLGVERLEHVCNFSAYISQNQRGRLDFCAENIRICVVALHQVLLNPSKSMGSTLGAKYDLILALRSQIFEYSRDLFYRYALEYL